MSLLLLSLAFGKRLLSRQSRVPIIFREVPKPEPPQLPVLRNWALYSSQMDVTLFRMTKESGFILTTVLRQTNHRRKHKAVHCLPKSAVTVRSGLAIPQIQPSPTHFPLMPPLGSNECMTLTTLFGGKACHTQNAESFPSHWDLSSLLYGTCLCLCSLPSVKISSGFAFSEVAQYLDTISTQWPHKSPAQGSSELPVNLTTHCQIPGPNIEKHGKHARNRFCFNATWAMLNILIFEAAAASGPTYRSISTLTSISLLLPNHVLF